ncbi:unnamed protein product [Diatraea saccharalis]|uniref:Uncharacterized protein n=1 Tax=Diatraea saccharalis TaxID=40085 RepID=A0A9N9WIW4_9NEOP|nr:unnamed protein product [Diatraea saccharalis]
MGIKKGWGSRGILEELPVAPNEENSQLSRSSVDSQYIPYVEDIIREHNYSSCSRSKRTHLHKLNSFKNNLNFEWFKVTAVDASYTFMPRAFWRTRPTPSPRDAVSTVPPMEAPPLPKQPVEPSGPPIKGILKKPMPMKYLS